MLNSQRSNESKRLRIAGLASVSAAAVLMMAWAIFPAPAAAAPTPVLVPGNPSCGDLGLLEANGTVTITGDEEEGTQQVAWSSSTPIDAVIVKGGNNANVYSYNEATSDSGLTAPINPNTNKPFGVSHVSLCYDEDVTTSSEPPTTSSEPPTTSSEPPTTSSEPPTTSSEPPTTSSQPPTTSVAPTTVTPPDDTTPPDATTVAPTTVTPPGGTAFTGVENVIPLGTIAVVLMTAGSGLLWAGSRRGRHEED